MNTAVTSLPIEGTPPVSARVATAAPVRWLKQAGAALSKAFIASGRARAEWQLLEFAERCEATQPELAKELRLACGHGRID
jgi:hypothetical protein